LIIYLPNYYMIGKTNVPTKETTYSVSLALHFRSPYLTWTNTRVLIALQKERMDEFFENGFAIATQNTGFKADTEWPACLACALIDHQIQRNSQARTKQCQKCFDSYCARV
jgi:lysophospholipase